MATFKNNLSFLRELFALKEVIDAGQIQGAARRNGIKQSNLSKIVSDLEAELNTPLLTRSFKGVEPTNTARLLYTDIENIVKSLDKITAAFTSAEELTGYVTVFVEDGFLGNRLLKELSLFYALHLKIRLDITTDKRISPSDADLAIVSDIPPEIKGKILFKLESKMHLYTSTSYLERKGAPRDMEDLLEKSKANPGTIKMGMSSGGNTHVYALLLQQAGFDCNIVDGGDGSDRIAALVGGHVDVCFVPYLTAKEYIENGDVTPLCTIGDRCSALPDTPSINESGYVKNNFNGCYIWMAPKGTDAGIVSYLASLCEDVVNNNAKYDEDQRAINFNDPFIVTGQDALDFLEELQQTAIENVGVLG